MDVSAGYRLVRRLFENSQIRRAPSQVLGLLAVPATLRSTQPRRSNMIKRCLAVLVLAFASATAVDAACPLFFVADGEFTFTKYFCVRDIQTTNACTYTCTVINK